MTFLVPKICQSIFLFTALFCCHLTANEMIYTFFIVSSLLRSLSKIFNRVDLGKMGQFLGIFYFSSFLCIFCAHVITKKKTCLT